MYQLYFDKQYFMLEIRFVSGGIIGTCATDKLIKYNGWNYVCSDKKLLIEKAEEIKLEWIKELEEKLKKVKNIEIAIRK